MGVNHFMFEEVSSIKKEKKKEREKRSKKLKKKLKTKGKKVNARSVFFQETWYLNVHIVRADRLLNQRPQIWQDLVYTSFMTVVQDCIPPIQKQQLVKSVPVWVVIVNRIGLGVGGHRSLLMLKVKGRKKGKERKGCWCTLSTRRVRMYK